MTELEIVEPGLCATLQDGGRYGWQRYGISPAGAMDPVALRLANALVRNPPLLGAIELALTGFQAILHGKGTRLAVAGASCSVTINGRSLPAFTAHPLGDGDRLVVGPMREGARAYVAVAGGFDVAPVLGSQSTHMRTAIGGVDGSALRAGMCLKLNPAPSGELRTLPSSKTRTAPGPIRVVLGPQASAFPPEAVEAFLRNAYVVSSRSDRMAFQLDGPPIAHGVSFNIVSDGTIDGSIQVPGHGRPIVLMADRQTTGGYPKIATVISADLPRLAQRPPGSTIQFQAVTTDAAEAAARRHEADIRTLVASIVPVATRGTYPSAEQLLGLNLVSGVVSATRDPASGRPR